MFFRLYVLIQKITNTINVEGVYSYDNAMNKKEELSIKYPFHNYYIDGPFKYHNVSVDNSFIPKPNILFNFPPIVEDHKPPFLINLKDPNNMYED
jgi:hypothetical protein